MSLLMPRSESLGHGAHELSRSPRPTSNLDAVFCPALWQGSSLNGNDSVLFSARHPLSKCHSGNPEEEKMPGISQPKRSFFVSVPREDNRVSHRKNSRGYISSLVAFKR